MNEELIRVPTLNGRDSCAATDDNEILCAKFGGPLDCNECDSGAGHIWVTPDQIIDYLALKLVS